MRVHCRLGQEHNAVYLLWFIPARQVLSFGATHPMNRRRGAMESVKTWRYRIGWAWKRSRETRYEDSVLAPFVQTGFLV